MTCGIYKITNKLNGHSYIGLSKNIERRFSDHKTKAFSSNRPDDKSKVLYQAFRKYGLESFSFEVIEECKAEDLAEREVYWIEFYQTYLNRNHYNETPGGDLPGDKTKHVGEEHGMSKLTESDVVFCREQYRQGSRSRAIWEENFQHKISYAGFQRMWHGKTWKHVMPEVFDSNPNPRQKYSARDRDAIVKRYRNSGLKMRQFCNLPSETVGYGTLWKMIHVPEFYK